MVVLHQEGPGLPATRIYPQLLAVPKRLPGTVYLLSVWVTFAAVRKVGGHSEVPSNSSGPCSYRAFPRDNVRKQVVKLSLLIVGWVLGINSEQCLLFTHTDNIQYFNEY